MAEVLGEGAAIATETKTVEFRSSYTRKRTSVSVSSGRLYLLGCDTGDGHQISGHFCTRERPGFFSWLFGRSDNTAETSRKDVREKDLGSISLVIDPLKEQEADRQAVAILRKAGYDPHAMLDVARRLPSGGHPSHLQNPRRIQSLGTSLATLPSIEIDESQAFQATKRDLEAELRGW